MKLNKRRVAEVNDSFVGWMPIPLIFAGIFFLILSHWLLGLGIVLCGLASFPWKVLQSDDEG